MKILHISKYYFPYIGGVENICKYLVDGCRDHECSVVCFNNNSHDIVEVVEKVKIYRVGAWVTIANQALSFSYFVVLRKAIKEIKPDVIQFHWANPFPAAVLLCVIPKSVKLIVHWHMDIIKQKKIYPLIKPVETALLKRANRIVVTSPQYRDGSKSLQPFIDKVRVVPNAIDEGVFRPQMYDKFRISDIQSRYQYKPIVFFVGRHIEYKGLPYLLEAEKYMKSDCVILIAGHGPLSGKLKRKCHSKRVHFLGRLTDDELRWYHYAASVFAFPSITKNEAFGIALAEAMYCYTPAVTFTIPGSGVNWVNLNGETGIEVPNRDSVAFASAIDSLITDKPLASKYAFAAHQRVVENFTIPKMIEKMNAVYYDL